MNKKQNGTIDFEGSKFGRMNYKKKFPGVKRRTFKVNC